MAPAQPRIGAEHHAEALEHTFYDGVAEIRSLLKMTRIRTERLAQCVASNADLSKEIQRLKRCVDEAIACIDQ